MKLSVMLGVLMISSAAFAGEIDLTAGSSATINANEPTIVKCAGDSAASQCSIQNAYGLFYVIQNGNTVATFNDINQAIATAKSMHDAGLCR